jgi:hypothetical protein
MPNSLSLVHQYSLFIQLYFHAVLLHLSGHAVNSIQGMDKIMETLENIGLKLLMLAALEECWF